MPASQLVQLNPVLIKVAGQDLDAKWYHRLEVVEVDLALGAPGGVPPAYQAVPRRDCLAGC